MHTIATLRWVPVDSQKTLILDPVGSRLLLQLSPGSDPIPMDLPEGFLFPTCISISGEKVALASEWNSGVLVGTLQASTLQWQNFLGEKEGLNFPIHVQWVDDALWTLSQANTHLQIWSHRDGHWHPSEKVLPGANMPFAFHFSADCLAWIDLHAIHFEQNGQTLRHSLPHPRLTRILAIRDGVVMVDLLDKQLMLFDSTGLHYGGEVNHPETLIWTAEGLQSGYGFRRQIPIKPTGLASFDLMRELTNLADPAHFFVGPAMGWDFSPEKAWTLAGCFARDQFLSAWQKAIDQADPPQKLKFFHALKNFCLKQSQNLWEGSSVDLLKAVVFHALFDLTQRLLGSLGDLKQSILESSQESPENLHLFRLLGAYFQSQRVMNLAVIKHSFEGYLFGRAEDYPFQHHAWFDVLRYQIFRGKWEEVRDFIAFAINFIKEPSAIGHLFEPLVLAGQAQLVVPLLTPKNIQHEAYQAFFAMRNQGGSPKLPLAMASHPDYHFWQGWLFLQACQEKLASHHFGLLNRQESNLKSRLFWATSNILVGKTDEVGTEAKRFPPPLRCLFETMVRLRVHGPLGLGDLDQHKPYLPIHLLKGIFLRLAGNLQKAREEMLLESFYPKWVRDLHLLVNAMAQGTYRTGEALELPLMAYFRCGSRMVNRKDSDFEDRLMEYANREKKCHGVGPIDSPEVLTNCMLWFVYTGASWQPFLP
ncbi:MAG: hypothetical protein H6510_00835 [Acidobacteria bacterium]|nr:hypothetical protein [Acidobacteriota bacterium]MCB9396333.1 hypothetical protein [Acidobacteriota bacterium]